MVRDPRTVSTRSNKLRRACNRVSILGYKPFTTFRRVPRMKELFCLFQPFSAIAGSGKALVTPVLDQSQKLDGLEVRLAWAQDGEFSSRKEDGLSQEQIRDRAERYVVRVTERDLEIASFNDGLLDLAHLGDTDLDAAKRRIGIDREALAPRIDGMVNAKTLYDHQIIGADRIVRAFHDSRVIRHLVADDVGLGKSIQALAAVLYPRIRYQTDPHLRTPHLVYQWADEIKEVTEQFKIHLYFGSTAKAKGNKIRYNLIERGDLTQDHPVFTSDDPGLHVIITSMETSVKRHGQGTHDKDYADVAVSDSKEAEEDDEDDPMQTRLQEMVPDEERDPSIGQQWYVAAIHNLAGISAGVVHTDIDLKDRHDHHGFRSEGTNMQKDCHNVHLFDYPPAMTTIHQAVGRVRRFRQNHVIKVFYYDLRHFFSFELFIQRTNQSSPTARADKPATNEGYYWAVDYYTMDNIEPAVYQHLAIYAGRQGRLMPEDEESEVDQLYINRLQVSRATEHPKTPKTVLRSTITTSPAGLTMQSFDPWDTLDVHHMRGLRHESPHSLRQPNTVRTNGYRQPVHGLLLSPLDLQIQIDNTEDPNQDNGGIDNQAQTWAPDDGDIEWDYAYINSNFDDTTCTNPEPSSKNNRTIESNDGSTDRSRKERLRCARNMMKNKSK
ncbi:hypothetical protein ZTR_08936 [Talaromyces verruculosus]|nr:hypothetical protein ZTR_08936 [Talaromyces verruculosus]